MDTQTPRECRADHLLRRWAVAIAIAAMAVVLFAAPGNAFAAGSVQTLNDMPFETAAQAAGHPVWNSNSKVTLSGSASFCGDTNQFTNSTNYTFFAVGDSITLENVGTDADGDAYDLKITLTSCGGKPMSSYFSKGYNSYTGNIVDDGWLRISIGNESSSVGNVQKGQKLSFDTNSKSSGDCQLRFQYLKHGTSSSANAALFSQIYDIDWNNYYNTSTSMASDFSKYAIFNGCEGIQTTDAKLYLSSSTKLSKDSSSGKVWVSAANAGNTSGKDWSTGVALAATSATTTVTIGALDDIDWYFDYQKAPSAPTKSAKITG